MTPSTRPSFLRTTLGRTAVSGAAALVTVMGIAPAAFADEDGTVPDTQVDPPAEEQNEQETPEQETPVETSTDEPSTEDTGTEESSDEETPAAGTTDGDEEEGGDEVEVAAVSAVDDPDVTTEANTPIEIDVLANDESDERVESLDVATEPTHGDAVVIGEAEALPELLSTLGGEVTTLAVPGAGSLKIRYTPDEDFVGTDSFTYTYTTAEGESAPATVTIEVTEAEEVEPVEPIFGTQKVLAGVQIKDGSYVEEGVTTVGSVIAIRVKPQDGPAYSVDDCITSQSFISAGSTRSDCGFPGASYPAGATITFTQVEAAPGLVKAAQPIVVEPCVINDAPGFDPCSTINGSVIFENTGLLPETVADLATTDEGEAVTIDVLRNDTSNDPATELEMGDQPDHGSAEVVGEGDAPPVVPSGVQILAVPSAGSLKIRYTPDAGFTGTDRFTYQLSNSNGSTTGQVAVRVVGGTVVPADSSSSGAVSASLPDAGGTDVRLLGLGVLLAAAGAFLVGRRRDGDVTRRG